MPHNTEKSNGFRTEEKPYQIALDSTPVTTQRLPYVPQPDDPLQDPGTARVNIAPSNEKPNGTTEDGWSEKHRQRTVLQQHCMYWDKDEDGVIWPTDTYRGFRAWGWNIFLSLLATFIINSTLSYATCQSILPDPLFRIHIPNIHKDMHGSVSMSYDMEGRFRPQNFEDIFAKYDRGNKGGLDLADMMRMLKGYRLAFDPFGWSAAAFEWVAVYLLLWPDDGIMRKEDIRGVFDGSIFQKKADQYAQKRARTW